MSQPTLLSSPTNAQEVRGPKTQPLSAYQDITGLRAHQKEATWPEPMGEGSS